MKLRQISHDTSFFRGILTLINDIYLPNNQPVFKALLKAVKVRLVSDVCVCVCVGFFLCCCFSLLFAFLRFGTRRNPTHTLIARHARPHGD